MCCFSQPVRHVSKTRILARALEGPRQLLVYAMSLVADSDLAMVLPIPVPPSSPEDAVRFVDMSSCPDFFDDLEVLFPEPPTRAHGGPILAPAAFAPQSLVVHDVGDFEASFVPTRADFDRLDPRFRLPSDVWDALPAYGDWGFCVFKLRPAKAIEHTPAPTPAPPKPFEAPGIVDRVRGLLGIADEPPFVPPPEARAFHPMAFDFPRRDPARLFFPTVHVHDGEVHPSAHFDHMLYCQTGLATTAAPDAPSPWRRSDSPALLVTTGALKWLDPTDHVSRLKMNGDLPNQDVFVPVAAG